MRKKYVYKKKKNLSKKCFFFLKKKKNLFKECFFFLKKKIYIIYIY